MNFSVKAIYRSNSKTFSCLVSLSKIGFVWNSIAADISDVNLFTTRSVSIKVPAVATTGKSFVVNKRLLLQIESCSIADFGALSGITKAFTSSALSEFFSLALTAA